MKQRNIVTINDGYSDWKVKGLLAEVVGYDRDKRYLVKLLEKSQTEYLNIGDAIWLKPHWLDGIENICNCFTAIHKFPYDLKVRKTHTMCMNEILPKFLNLSEGFKDNLLRLLKVINLIGEVFK